MTGPLRFEVLIVPNQPWETVLARFRSIEALGFDIGGLADHFVDWTNPPRPWFDLWATLGAVAQATTTLRLRPCVAQIPLRDPATFARQALSLDHISGGRIELGSRDRAHHRPFLRDDGAPELVEPRAGGAAEGVPGDSSTGMLTNEVNVVRGRVLPPSERAVLNPARPVQSPAPADDAGGDGAGDAEARGPATRTSGTA